MMPDYSAYIASAYAIATLVICWMIGSSVVGYRRAKKASGEK